MTTGTLNARAADLKDKIMDKLVLRWTVTCKVITAPFTFYCAGSNLPLRSISESGSSGYKTADSNLLFRAAIFEPKTYMINIDSWTWTTGMIVAITTSMSQEEWCHFQGHLFLRSPGATRSLLWTKSVSHRSNAVDEILMVCCHL